MKRLYSTLLLLLLSVFLFQCQREVSYAGGPDNPGELAIPDPITAALQGNIFDESGAPAAGVSVQVGSKTATTNASGYFRINDAALDKRSSLVVATKAGYFKAFRTFSATSGANQVVVKLIKKVLAGTIDAATGGEVSLSNGSKVALSANGVVNAATTAAYTGTVNVYAAYIDPTSSDIDQTVPGSFMANDKDGKRVLLNSYGMLAVELESAAGAKLQIKPGSVAKLTTAIPASAQASAPATIPLWYVDETTGLWKEDGAATKSGNVYVGDVKHFSFWNCDVSAKAVFISMTFKTSSGAPVVHTEVRIKRTTNNWEGYGSTDSLGQVSGYVPNSEALVLDVVDHCNNAFYTQNIGPYAQNVNLGSITLSPSVTSVITVKGKLVNCSNVAVSNGYAVVSFGAENEFARVNATGDFQTTFTRCGSSPTTVSIAGVDVTSQQQSTTPTAVAVAGSIMDAGTVSACGMSTTEFINYTLDGTMVNIGTNADTLHATSQPIGGGGPREIVTYIDGFKAGTSNFLLLEFVSANETAGSYPVTNINVSSFDSLTVSTGMNITITNFPTANNGFYEGSFSGQYRDGSATLHTLSGTFRVRRR